MGLQFILRAPSVARIVLFAGVFTMAAQSTRAQVVVRGVLYDDANGTRLRGTVMLVDPSTDAPMVHTTTDSLGQFSLKTTSGVFQIAAVRPGYTSVLSAPVKAQNGEQFTVNIPIAAAGDPQHRIAVVEHIKPATPGPQEANEQIADGMAPADADRFRSRKALGTGLHYGRKDFEKLNVTTLGEFLQGIPGLSVRDPSSTSSMQTTRSSAMPSAVAPRGSSACHLGWFVDGHRMDLPGRSDPVTDGLGSLQLDAISAIEIFRGLSEMPPEFADPDLRCGAIAIWTRRG